MSYHPVGAVSFDFSASGDGADASLVRSGDVQHVATQNSVACNAPWGIKADGSCGPCPSGTSLSGGKCVSKGYSAGTATSALAQDHCEFVGGVYKRVPGPPPYGWVGKVTSTPLFTATCWSPPVKGTVKSPTGYPTSIFTSAPAQPANTLWLPPAPAPAKPSAPTYRIVTRPSQPDLYLMPARPPVMVEGGPPVPIPPEPPASHAGAYALAALVIVGLGIAAIVATRDKAEA